MDIISSLPTELTARVMTSLLLHHHHGYIDLFIFMKAFPAISRLVLLVHPHSTELALSPLGIPSGITDQLMCPHLLTSPMGPDQDDDTLVWNIQTSSTLLKILLLPNVEENVFHLSQKRFSSSSLAGAIQNCHAVVVGANEEQTQYRGFQLISNWCSGASTPLQVYHEGGYQQRFKKTFMHRIFPSAKKYKPKPIPRSIREYVASPYDLPIDGIIFMEDKLATTVTFSNYQNHLSSMIPSAKGAKLIIPSRCLSECDKPHVRLYVATLESLHAEFTSCLLPELEIIGSLGFLSSPQKELVLENTNWSVDNPLGAKLCDQARSRGILYQSDYCARFTFKPRSNFRSPRVTLVGLPQFALHVMSLDCLVHLVWKRLESPFPPRHPGMELTFQLLLLPLIKSMVLVGTSNMVYHRALAIRAPRLEGLSIRMLRGSTMIWDIWSLLFSRSSHLSSVTRHLKSLRMEYIGHHSIPLRLADIESVANTLETLWVKGLAPSFLDDLVAPHDMQDIQVLFNNLKSLRVDVDRTSKAGISNIDTYNFPKLTRLVLGGLGCHGSLREPVIDIPQQLKESLILTCIPESLDLFTIDKSFPLSFTDLVMPYGLTLEDSGGYDWGTWDRSLSQNRAQFRYIGITSDKEFGDSNWY